MSLLTKKKFIEANAVDETKIRLSNNAYVRARNAADNADVNIYKVNASDAIEYASLPVFSGSSFATQDYVDTAVNGLTGAFVYKGTWDASLNSPSLANGVGTTGWLYAVTVAGTVDFGAGNITFAVGDKVAYNGSIWEKWDVNDNEFATNTTDNLTEGATNLYHTVARARTAAVVNSTAGNETDQAASVDAMKSYVAAQIGAAGSYITHESFTLAGGDITNGYVTLASAPEAESVIVGLVGAPGLARNGVDFTIGGPSLDRVVFAGALLSLVEAGDILEIYYQV